MARAFATVFVLLFCLPVAAFGADAKHLPAPQPVHADTSSPDAWGYTWVRSTDPGGPTFNWIDISTIGTLIPAFPASGSLGDDNSVGPFPMQFSFSYYWYEVTNFRIGSNGYLVFGNQTANFASPFAQLPNVAAPNDMLAPLVGDLDFTVNASNPRCYYWSNGVDTLVVSFIDVSEWQVTTNPNLKHTFQIVLSKQDSTILFQYGVQQGQYNAPNNQTLCIGIENQTGQIGLNYTFSAAPPHALMPSNGQALKFKRTVNTGLQVTDAGVLGVFNAENLARMVRVGQPDTINAIVRNFGTANLSNVRVTYNITRTGQPAQRDTVFLASLSAAEQVNVVFPRPFTPAVTGSYSASINAFVTGDVGPANNTRIAEIVSVNLAPGVRTPLAYEVGTVSGSINWSGGGGMAVLFDVPAQQVRIESVYVQVAGITSQPMTVEILDGTGGVPGAILATRVVTAAVGINGISVASDSIRITDGEFFVSARGQMAFGYEATAPISFRTWEYTNGYAPYRSRDVQDAIIRATVMEEVVVSVGETPQLPGRITLHQNYPNPFNPSTRIEYSLPAQTQVRLVIYDMIGREVRTLVRDAVQSPGTYTEEWDGRNTAGAVMPSGTYFVRLESGSYTETKKLLLMK